MQTPVTEAPGIGEAFEGSRSDAGVNKGRCSEDCQTRSDCHSAVVRNPANKRVHGYQGTMLKRLAVPNRIGAKQEQSTNAALVNDVVAESEEQWSWLPDEARCWASVHATEGGAGAEQGRSRHRTITPVWGAKPSDGPHFKVPRATSICRRLQGITRLRQAISFHFIMVAMHITMDHCHQKQDASNCLRLQRSTHPTSQPSLADRIWLEVLSLALSWATPLSLVAELRYGGQQIGVRIKNDHGGIWVPGPVCHPCPLTPGPDRACVGVPVSKSTCTCAMFKPTRLACLMLALQWPFRHCLRRLSSPPSASPDQQNAARLEAWGASIASQADDAVIRLFGTVAPRLAI
jgi:hypothetical protein